MTSIVSVLDDAASLATKEFTIANASQSGRVVALITGQSRNPVNASTVTLNGVAPTGVTVGRHVTNTTVGTLVAYWSDADLPPAAGTYAYTINDGGPSTCIFELAGWDEGVPEVIDQSLAGPVTDPQNITFTGSNAGSVLLLGAAQATGSPFNILSGQTIEYEEFKEAVVSKVDAANDGFIVLSFGSSDIVATAIAFNSASGTDYTIRKGSTATITHTLTAAGITSATLNGEAVTLGPQSGQTVDISFTDTIATSGEYPLVLTDSAAATQTLTVQYNVYGLPSSTIRKDGVALGGLTNIEIIVMTGGVLPRTFLEQLTGNTTDSGNTGNIVIVNELAVPGENVVVSLRSFSEGVGIVYGTPLETL